MNSAGVVECVCLSPAISSRVEKCGRLQELFNRFSFCVRGALVAEPLRFAKSTRTGVFASLRCPQGRHSTECADQKPAKLECVSDVRSLLVFRPIISWVCL